LKKDRKKNETIKKHEKRIIINWVFNKDLIEIIINEKEQWKIPFLFCPIKINSINKVSVKAKPISKVNSNEMMLLQRKTNRRITDTC